MGGNRNIWEISQEHFFPIQVTSEGGNIANFRVSPDGEKIAFLVDKGEGREKYNLCVCDCTGRDLKKINTQGSIEIADLDWSPDSRKLAYISESEGHYNIYTVCVNDGKYTQITDTPELKRDPRWSFDGKKIAWFSMRGNSEGDIVVCSLSENKTGRITSHLRGVNSYPRWSPGGDFIAFISDGKGMKRLYIISYPEGKITSLPDDNYEENRPEWSPRGGKLLYLSGREGNMVIYIYDLLTGKSEPFGFEKGVVSSARWSFDGESIAFRYHSSLNPPELFIASKKEIKKITRSAPAGIIKDDLVDSREVYYHSSHKTEIPAFLYLPEGKGPHPAIVWPHGGPASQHFNGWDPFVQIIVSAGIALLAPNIRGSTGRGRDFENALYRDWGGVDLEDIISAAKYLKNLDCIDSSRIAVGGASYGGFITMMALVKAPELWAGGINAIGPVNLATFYKNTSGWLRLLLIEKYGFKPPEDDPEFYFERSPVNFIKNLNAPLLLIYNENDTRVPGEELEQLIMELKKHNKDYEVVLFPNEGHGWTNMSNELERYKIIKKFLKGILF